MSASAFTTDPEIRARLRAIRLNLCRQNTYEHASEFHNDIAYLWEHSTFAEWFRLLDKALQIGVCDYLEAHWPLLGQKR